MNVITLNNQEKLAWASLVRQYSNRKRLCEAVNLPYASSQTLHHNSTCSARTYQLLQPVLAAECRKLGLDAFVDNKPGEEKVIKTKHETPQAESVPFQENLNWNEQEDARKALEDSFRIPKTEEPEPSNLPILDEQAVRQPSEQSVDNMVYALAHKLLDELSCKGQAKALQFMLSIQYADEDRF